VRGLGPVAEADDAHLVRDRELEVGAGPQCPDGEPRAQADERVRARLLHRQRLERGLVAVPLGHVRALHHRGVGTRALAEGPLLHLDRRGLVLEREERRALVPALGEVAEHGVVHLAGVDRDPPRGRVGAKRADADERHARLEHGPDERVVVVGEHEHDPVHATVEQRCGELGRGVGRHVEEAEPAVEPGERERRQELLEERVQQQVGAGERDRQRQRVRPAGREGTRDRARPVGEPLRCVEHALPRRLVDPPLPREDV
jgi:hypothetical protein